jgi:hypothetical protein
MSAPANAERAASADAALKASRQRDRLAKRHMPASAKKNRNNRRHNERQGDVRAATGEGVRRDAEAHREGRRARSREGRHAGKGQMGS